MIISFPIKSTIDSRRSARSFKMISVEKVVIESIQDFVKSFFIIL